jgi:hypothetical protein
MVERINQNDLKLVSALPCQMQNTTLNWQEKGAFFFKKNLFMNIYVYMSFPQDPTPNLILQSVGYNQKITNWL